MADAPKPQRRRRRQNVAGTSSAAPTADTSPSGVSNSTQPRPRRRRRQQPRRSRAPKVVQEILEVRPTGGRRRLTRAIKRELKREGVDGPKVSVQQKITSTFGLVNPNTTGNVELELNFFLHPSLAKEANDGTAFGPVQALAAQYSLWKLKYLLVRFTPMVGASAVSGTVVRASLNMSQSPGTSNWSGLGTRVHVDMHPGQSTTFRLRADQLGGPRDGGWWFTDTNEEGSQSAGPIVEVHTMGKTKSTFQSNDWTGPLFLVEGIGLWQFANYNVKPALGSLERREGEAQVEIKTTASQPLTMEITSSDLPAMFMDSLEPESYATATGQTVGETIFQIVDVGATLAQNVAPPPFGWLIKGGWWFVKKLLKRGARASPDTSEFVVYASLQDAQNNKPAIATATQQTSKFGTTLMVTQINSPNVGPNPTVAATPRAGPQPVQPGDTFRVSSQMITELFVRVTKGSAGISVPVSSIPGLLRRFVSGQVLEPRPTSTQIPSTQSDVMFIQTPWWVGSPGKGPGELGLIPDQPSEVNATEYLPANQKGGYVHSLYYLHDPRFVNQSGTYEFLEPEIDEDMANFCVMSPFGDGKISRANAYFPYGKVVATSKIHSGTNPSLDMVVNLIKVTKTITFGKGPDDGGVDGVRDMVIVYPDNADRISFMYQIPRPGGGTSVAGNWSILERNIPVGSFLLAFGYTNAAGEANGADITTWLRFGTYSRVETTFAPIFPYNLSGQWLPGTSVDIKLKYINYHPPTQELIDQLRYLSVPFSLPSYPLEESGKPGPSVGGQDGGQGIPCILPPIPEDDKDDEVHHHEDNCSCGDDSDSDDSVERFILELGNDMIEFPKRWLNDPEFSRFLDM